MKYFKFLIGLGLYLILLSISMVLNPIFEFIERNDHDQPLSQFIFDLMMTDKIINWDKIF